MSSLNSSIGRRQKRKSAESKASCMIGMNRTENLWRINYKWRICESSYDEFYFKSLMLCINEFMLLEKCKARTAVLDHFCRKQIQLVFPWWHMSLHSQHTLSSWTADFFPTTYVTCSADIIHTPHIYSTGG